MTAHPQVTGAGSRASVWPRGVAEQGWWLPTTVALMALGCCLIGQRIQPGTNDWGHFWTAGRALVTGANPYEAVDALGTGYPLYYPGPAVLVLAPFGLVPLRAAWVAFATLSGLAFGLAARRYGRGLWVGAISAAFFEAVLLGQWSPAVVAAAAIPALGFMYAVKPSIGVALFVFRPYRHAALSALAITVLSFIVIPGWPLDWLEALKRTNHIPPVMKPWGWVLLLGALRWRTPEGRLLLTLSLVPQTTSLYEALPLFLIPRDRWEGYGLAALSYVVAFTQGEWVPGVSIEAGLAQRWSVIFGFLWLPALALVLRPTRLPVHRSTGNTEPARASESGG